MKTHYLKTVQPYFDEVFAGRKRFEVRKNDMDFNVGDEVFLQEYTENKDYTGRAVKGDITYVLKDYPVIDPEYVVFSFVTKSNFE